ncbi:hypothetical protein BH10BAC5_BH10BAC5_20310 [soil metagenome]
MNMFTYKYDLKLLQLMIYYELDYFEEAFSMLDSFRHFLANNKNVSERRGKSHEEFTNCYTDLLKCKTENSKKKPDEIKQELKTVYDSLRYKDWLYAKADELIDKVKTKQKIYKGI